jgi:hypothetical protein
MKWSTIALSLLTSLTIAAPIEPTPKHDLYILRVLVSLHSLPHNPYQIDH